MNTGDKERLRKTHIELIENVSPKDILPLLHQEGILNADDEERVLAEKTRKDKLCTLLSLLPLRGPRAYGVFRQALAADYEWIVAALDRVPVATSIVEEVDGVAGGAAQTEPIKGPMAEGAVPLPPWDRDNPDVEELLSNSVYRDILNTSRNNIIDKLDLDILWPHLKTLKVISKVNIETLTHNKPRPGAVDALIDYVEMRPVWYYHALLRAMALTGQTEVIPEGGLDKAVYTQGCQVEHQEGAQLKLLSKDVLKIIRDHCQSYQTSLMRRHVYDFPGDAGDDVIDISSCIINIDPYMNDGSQIRSIQTSQILEQLHGEIPPRVIRLYGDPGDGKTSLMRHIAHHWSMEFPQLIENDEYMTSEPLIWPLTWTTLVYLEARNIKTTVEDAIRDALGCKVSDTEILMDHIRTGDRVAILIDAIDELRNQSVLDEVKWYVHERKMKGGPTVLMSARTGICPINAQDIDRFLILQGFKEDDGIQYVKKYTKMSQLPDHDVNHYVVKHRVDLQPVLTNPLRLYLFSALAVRGEINLEEDGQFNILNIFQPLERYLLRRSKTQVTEQQSSDFYRMCLWGLLTGLREFSETHLAHFNVSPAYHVFLQRSDRRRSEDGELVAHYTFSHEMTYEYFGGCYIQTLSTRQKEAFLVSICQNKYLRNLQKIMFQILHQDWRANSKLIQMMVRCMLSLEHAGSDLSDGTYLCGTINLRAKSGSSLEDMLYSNMKEFSCTDASVVCQQINNGFDNSAEMLKENAAFCAMKENGTICHVVDCLQVCSAEQREELLNETIFHLLPCSYKDTEYLQTGDTTWGQAQATDKQLTMKTCTPREAAELLTQCVTIGHRRVSNPTWKLTSIHLCDKDYTLWGVPPDSSWSKGEWDTLFNKLVELQVEDLDLYVEKRTPLTGVLMYLLDHAAALHKMWISVYCGTTQLTDLVTLLPACHQAGLSLLLRRTHIVVSREVAVSTQQLQRNMLCQLRYPPTDLSCGDYKMLGSITWLTL